MRTFKLIQEYPNSPKEGYKIIFREGYPFQYNAQGVFYLEDCEKYSKNWEEIIDKDYEILSIRKTQRKDNINSINEWVPNRYEGITLEQILYVGYCVKSDHYYIHSVKRLSDGEIFTIGDLVESSSNPERFRGKITEFKVVEDCILFVYYKGRDHIQHIQKTKIKPLFTTEDGVDIFEGNGVFGVDEKFRIFYFHAIDKNDNELFKRFSTKEKAQEYINSQYKFTLNDYEQAWLAGGGNQDLNDCRSSKLYKNLLKQIKNE